MLIYTYIRTYKVLREHFMMLQKELLQVHQERSRLSKQLRKGIEGDKLLQTLKEEQELEKKSIMNEIELKEHAQRTVDDMKEENHQLEGTLQSYLDKLVNAQAELEDLRYQRIEDDNEEVYINPHTYINTHTCAHTYTHTQAADIFRKTNKAVLRVAYRRFLNSMQVRVKVRIYMCSCIYT